MQESEKGNTTENNRDNRLLIDNNTAQNLSSNDIDTMRKLVIRSCLSYFVYDVYVC